MAQQISVADVVYPYNPLNNVAGAQGIVENHTLTPANGVNYVTIIPRAAPFFRRTVKIINVATGQPLVMDQNFTLGYFFAPFTALTYKGLYGGITFNELDAPIEVQITYDTLGGDFVLNSTKYAELAANIVNNPRELDWSQIADTPATYPPIDHQHSADQTLNYMDYVEQLDGLKSVITAAINGYVGALNTHIDTEGNAHQMTKLQFGIGNVPNWAPATVDDLPSQGSDLVMSLDMVKRAFNYMYTGATVTALKSAVVSDVVSSASIVQQLAILNDAGLLTTDEVANFTQWKTYRAQMLIKASTGAANTLTPPATNTAFARLLGG